MKRLALLALAPFAIAASNPATETQHVVEEGETLNGIANRAGVSAAVIAAANGIQEPYVVQKGQKLFIPRQRSHTVKSGETAMGIANRYRVPYSALRTANGLKSNGAIRVGQKLIIPAIAPERTISRSIPATRKTPYFRPPHGGRILYGYKVRADGGGHEGYDYAVKAGDMVRASASGTVTFAGTDPKRFGKIVIISHGNGWLSAYGHLSQITVKKGESVKQGERIGLAGQSGVATYPELHFEIRKDGKPVNPKGRLSSR